MRLSDELRARTKAFGSAVIRYFVALPRNREEVRILGRQLIRAGTSVAAHTREASRARSDAEFCSKLDGLLQEADETQLWLEFLREDCGQTDEANAWLIQECEELIAIFATIVSKVRKNRKS